MEGIAQLPLPVEGVHQELNEHELPPTALSNAENWLLLNGRMRVREGLETVGTSVTARPNGMIGYTDGDGEQILIMATVDDIYVFDDTTQDWISLTASLTATVTDHTVFRVFQLGGASGPTTTLYAHNGKDRGKTWSFGDAAVANQGGNAPAGKAMMILADHMLLGNLATATGYTGAIGPSVVAVSDSQNPESGWNTVLIADLADTPGGIVAMQEMGNLQGAIYKTDAVYLATASAAKDPFTFELKRAGVAGPVSPRAVVASSDGAHYYLATDGNVMVFDGVDVRPIGLTPDGESPIQSYVLNTWDVDMSNRAHGVYDDEHRILIFWYAGIENAEPTRGIIVKIGNGSVWPLHYSTAITAAVKAKLPGGTTIGDLAVGLLNLNVGDLTKTLAEYSALGFALILGDSAGQTYKQAGTTDNGTPIDAFFETGASGLADPLRFKSVRYMDHLFTTAAAAQNVNITLKRSNYGEDLVSDSSRSVDVSAGGPYRTHHRFPGRRYALRMSASATQEIEWVGTTVIYALQGRK